MYRHRHLGSSTCWTRRHRMHTKTRKKSCDFPWWPVSPSPTTVGVVAPGPDGDVVRPRVLNCLKGQLWLTKAQSRVAPYLELFGIHDSTCVPILVLLCKFEQLI